eukprot:CAMPEP_0206488404 /NCGR_PEP_ID=MMETSP0324_2-20121206/42386_1 /ASSEMBLY_ACC=CAM_ASM_000836 /TAXON_ID=2866 /ORGANISM="Crypthecodinium cohnii, Strain Seligo" /LENGTH=408 /DNA_ID=CAMNT_0053967409 /DNA_START=30 /DNA_END=1253 /DNA_ORIENTATION=-
MAENGRPEEEEIPTEFECTICMRLLLDPVTVGCGHTFCKACVQQSLGYRSLCAVCRAPIVSGQGVNILVRNMVESRFPNALARRKQEAEEELRQQDREAAEAQRAEAMGGGGGGGGAPADAAYLPMLSFDKLEGSVLLPHCPAEVVLNSLAEFALLDYALAGGRRIAVIEDPQVLQGGYDAVARPIGVCLEVSRCHRNPREARVRLVGRFRFRLLEAPQLHQDGFFLGRCEAFFDTPLPLEELSGEAPEQQSEEGEEVIDMPEPTAPELARAAVALLEGQFAHVGQAGKYQLFESLGEPPAPPAEGRAATSAGLEKLSFYLLAAIHTELAERRHHLASTDTKSRLRFLVDRLQKAGTRPILNLPGAASWMMSAGQSALGSFAIFLVVALLFLGKALGWFDEAPARHYR